MAYTTIDDPTDYFNTILWTGASDTAGRSFTGVGFQPDLVWSKIRDDTYHHNWFDSVRTAGSDKEINSNTSGAEGSGDTDGYGFISSFDTDGFTSAPGTASGGRNLEYNQNGNTFVAWNWKAGGSASSNSDGSITSSVSANTTSGFSIVSYTGTGSAATVGHGLGVVPDWIIFKNRETDGQNWIVYQDLTSATPQDDFLKLNATSAVATSTSFGNNTAPTTSVFSVGANDNTNKSGEGQIAYCFAQKKGYSKFGKYTGNNNSNGNFIYTGFKPAWILSKDSASGQEWHLIDNKRDAFNDDDNAHLSPNRNHSEATVKSNRGTMKTDLLSNGFKLNTDGSHTNGTGTHIFFAFAESPFVNSNGVPNNAR